VKGPTGAPERKPFDTRRETTEREWFLVRLTRRGACMGTPHSSNTASGSLRGFCIRVIHVLLRFCALTHAGDCCAGLLMWGISVQDQ